ncbi:phage antirepressor KilAC domain-containing protein [Prevotella bivia]|uniref:phage antirepressor KilAC domain-containing protein n=1 Tax=Prevotella bivia TaxID=28125 RepID=UPI00254F8FA1|nr:phage antirepressor KilAC domain-containing protein [Prevotella bivia]MDK7762535.1 phage antirepressor KilAC domain-containing protein [Prevotella bivia]
MSNLSVFQYSDAPISFRKETGSLFVNATEMAKGFGKTTKDWLRTKQSEEFISSLSTVRQISPTGLVQIIQGGNPELQGTWMHEDVALEFARWLSPTFAIWCNDRIKELLQIGFTATQPTIEQLVENPDLIIEVASKLKMLRQQNTEQQKQIAIQNRQLDSLTTEVVDLQKKTDYIEVILSSKETVTITQIAQDYGMSAKAFNKVLADLKIQRKVNKQWILYTPYLNMGFVHSKTIQITHHNGTIGTVQHTEWRQKGRLFLYEELKKHNILPMIERK